MAVVPDSGGLARVGESTTVAPDRGMAEGVTGLQALGVREMTYKMLFVGMYSLSLSFYLSLSLSLSLCVYVYI